MLKEKRDGFAVCGYENSLFRIEPSGGSARFKGNIEFSSVSIDKNQNGFVGSQL